MDGLIANLYELFGFLNQGNFSNDMYQNGFYKPIFIIMIAICLVVPVLYYYAINHPRINRWYHWLFFNLGTSLLDFIVAWVVASDKIVNYYAQQEMEAPYDWTNYLLLSLMAFLWSFVCFFLFSFVIKWWSTNCKHTPFV
ncbi:MAG: hypothetical protein NC038_00015 [Paludibacter sp.]|nr:hypothetical protein [Bacteroidales bacterium]MCM1068776.1 hypothetical protein [Prevotella sp.]MCM1354488.1 hypothetical protein [Bacteroides sp.]MCM1443291.1 hypothetical protein [Muribaculum sp.]MCM1481024.1 hypothetical protein [Paludibacter sp.]